MKTKRSVTVVITPGRIFTFGNLDLAHKFARRARKCPSMQGQMVEVVYTTMFAGRKRNPATIRMERQEALERALHATCESKVFCSL